MSFRTTRTSYLTSHFQCQFLCIRINKPVFNQCQPTGYLKCFFIDSSFYCTELNPCNSFGSRRSTIHSQNFLMGCGETILSPGFFWGSSFTSDQPLGAQILHVHLYCNSCSFQSLLVPNFSVDVELCLVDL